jgi:hypothetical protein
MLPTVRKRLVVLGLATLVAIATLFGEYLYRC